MISHNKRFLFTHINKCGGTSVARVLMPFLETPMTENVHHHAKSEMQSCKDHPQTYYKFTVVRNPWDRVVSNYFYNKNRKQTGVYQQLNSIPFEGFIEQYCMPVPRNSREFPDLFFGQCYNWITDHEGSVLVDEVFKLENLDKEWYYLCHRLGVCAKLPHENKSAHRDYREYYTDETAEIVGELFQDDIEAFNYGFEG